MRATIQRNAETGTDGLNHPLPANYEQLAIVPCKVWSASQQDRFIDSVAKTAVVQYFKGTFPRNADITKSDRISTITNRAGVPIFEGPFAIETLDIKPGHLELNLKQVVSSL